MLLTEAPGTSEATREQFVAALFAEHKIAGLHVAAAPLLAMYNTNFDTGILVDVSAWPCHF